VCVTNLVKYLPIDEGTDIWVRTISSSTDIVRCDMSESIIKAGFDIRSNTEWLTAFYEKLALDVL
jgi:hypothetical protein